MKALLWFVLCAALAANLSLNLLENNALHIVLSVVSGLVVIGSGVGLWMLRREARVRAAPIARGPVERTSGATGTMGGPQRFCTSLP